MKIEISILKIPILKYALNSHLNGIYMRKHKLNASQSILSNISLGKTWKLSDFDYSY